MGMLDGLLGQLGGGGIDIRNLAERVGLDAGQVESAIAALARAHAQPGDTVQQAAGETGFDPAVLQQLVAHIGGEGALGQFAALLGQGGAGGVLGSLGGLFGKS